MRAYMFYEIRKGKTRRREESFSFSNEGGSRGGMASRRMDDLPLLAALPRVGATDNRKCRDRVMSATRKRNIIRCEIRARDRRLNGRGMGEDRG